MKDVLQGRHPLPHLINFMSINVGRGGITQDIALARACELKLDVLLIQEPWWSGCTKSHPYFERFTPYGGTYVRPRAITYIRKDVAINSEQIFPCNNLTADYCWVVVNGITFLNVYKAPHDISAVRPLINWKPPSGLLAVGDFNSVYWGWQPGTTITYGQGEEIERWAEEHNLTCLIVGEPTHGAGNTFDLAWNNIAVARAWVERDECVTSDHLPICGSVPCRNLTKVTNKGTLKVAKDKLPQFAQVVSQWIESFDSIDSIEKIEDVTEGICKVLMDAVKAVGKRSNQASGRCAPW